MPWDPNDRKDTIAKNTAKSNGSVFTKRRKEYFFAGFKNNGQRQKFKNDYKHVTGVRVEDWPYHDPNMFIVKVTPL